MHHSLASVAFLAALASASPAVPDNNNPEKRSAFSLKQVENGKFTGSKNGLDDRVWAYVKYGAQLPDSLQEAIRMGNHVNQRFKALVGRDDDDTDGVGTVGAFPPEDIDIQYVVPVQIGTPEQTVYLNLDTGSADLWTFSTDTETDHVGEHAIYDAHVSGTSELQQDQKWRITYGDGSSASGIVYKDRVVVGDTSVDDQIVQSATQVSGSFTDDEFASGIMGMGFGRGTTVREDGDKQDVKTYLENLAPTLDAPLFTANLKAGEPGNYNFGYINGSEFAGGYGSDESDAESLPESVIGYANVTAENAYWEIAIDAVGVGSGADALEEGSSLDRVVVDTGTTLLLVPNEMTDAYYRQVDGAGFEWSWGGYLFPCDAELPDWSFGVGDYVGTIPGELMSYNDVNATHCFGGIQSSEGIPFSLFGAVVMKAQFTVFDLVDAEGGETPRVGFANKARSDM